MAYSHTNSKGVTYYLHSRKTVLKGGREQTIYYFGKEAKDGVYAQIKGESAVKIADKESLEKLNKGESDFLEPPPATTTEQSPQTPATKK